MGHGARFPAYPGMPDYMSGFPQIPPVGGGQPSFTQQMTPEAMTPFGYPDLLGHNPVNYLGIMKSCSMNLFLRTISHLIIFSCQEFLHFLI